MDLHIKAEHLKKHYQLGQSIVKAIDDVSLEINRGEMVIILGPSGSGKSTLLNMIGGVDKPDSGTVLIGGQPIHKFNTGQLTKFRRDKVGFVFQFYSLVPTLTAGENVEMAAELVHLRGKKLQLRSHEVLESVGLKDRYHSYPSMLSGGERQRVALARALAKQPELIIVDEPTGQLDEESGQAMVKLIRDSAKEYGSTVLMVTHDRELSQFADRVIELRSGKLVQYD